MSFIGRILSDPPCSAVAAGSTGSGSDLDQQLKIWKDLAITKQMIMNEAASALRLRGEWTQDELREALDNAIAKANAADAEVAKTREEADRMIAEMTDKVRKGTKELADAKNRISEAEAERDTADRQLVNGRKDNSEALKKAKLQVEDKQRELKAINQALADTPENVVKKLKNLKRQKHEENTARTKAEEQNRKYKKQVKEQEEKLEELDTLSDDSASLLEAYRELRKFCDSNLKPAEGDDDASEMPEMPKVDHELLGRIEKITKKDDEAAEA